MRGFTDIRLLLAPVFFFHGGNFDFGGVEADDLQVYAAVRADNDLVGLGVLAEFEFGFTFWAGYCLHISSPLIKRFDD